MLVLTGTSGGLGSVVIRTIIARKLIPLKSLRISAYNEKSLPAEVREAGIEVRFGDLRKPESLAASYAGADTLFLVSYPSVGEERYVLHKNAIDAAKEVGVKHIIYTSLSFGGQAGEKSVAGVMHAHLETTRYLKSTGLAWTVLRMGTYDHLWPNFAGFFTLDGSKNEFDVVIPADGPNHWTNREDQGEATAMILTNLDKYINETVSLVGPELLTIENIVNLYAEFSGRKMNVKILPKLEAIAYQTARGILPPDQLPFLENWASWHDAMSKGETGWLDPAIEHLLGRKPKTIKDQSTFLFSSANKLDTKDFTDIE